MTRPHQYKFGKVTSQLHSSANTPSSSTMPAATLPPPKRVLADSTKAHSNANFTIPSPNTAKRRKLETGSSPSKRLKVSQNGTKMGSSQPKSQFEDSLEKLTQDISGLKQQNSEKDQQWDRPGLDDFDENRDSLCFQQIEAEEGTLHGGRTTIKLFGVTEVRNTSVRDLSSPEPSRYTRLVTLCFSMSPTSSTTSTLRLRFPSQRPIAKASKHTSRPSWHNINPPYTPCRW